MNLHIVPDNVFSNKFFENLQEAGIVDNNRVVVRTNNVKLLHIRHNLPFARINSKLFESLTGPTDHYDRVYIHFFTPLLYRWVASHTFKELNWMVWGADLYNLPSVKTKLYEALTLKEYVNRNLDMKGFLYRAKVRVLHESHRKNAYAKIGNVLTWMDGEYEFALNNVHGLKANHQFFFYENSMPYAALEDVMNESRTRVDNKKPLYILGNSATPELNHLDAIEWMNSVGIQADICVPVSYGDTGYARFLKRKLLIYKGGELTFQDQYMEFQEYLSFLNKADGLIMNNIRPQGYGNIFMMMYLGKAVYLNKDNLSIPSLDSNKLLWQPLESIDVRSVLNWSSNRSAVSRLLSHSRLLGVYRELFS